MRLREWLAVQQRRLFFDLSYWHSPPWDTGITPPEVVAFVSAHPPGRALDLGCGTGTNALFLAQRGWEAWGVDYSGRAVRAGKRKARQAGQAIHLLQGDVSRPLAVKGVFDLIVDIGCLHVIAAPGRAGYADNLSRHLAHGGYYLLYGFLGDAENPAAPGLQTADFERLGGWLKLENREDGLDPNGKRSTWLVYRRV